jgi:hypothetical protein
MLLRSKETTMNLILTYAKRAILSVAVLALVLTLAGPARSQQTFQVTLTGSFWGAKVKDNDGTLATLYVAFRGDGAFKLMKVNAQGKTVADIEGRYTFDGTYVRFYRDGNLLGTTKVTYINADTFVAGAGDNRELWVRMKS